MTYFANLIQSAYQQKTAKNQVAAFKQASTMAKNCLNLISEANKLTKYAKSIKKTKRLA